MAMELLAFLGQIKSAIKTLTTLKNFIRNEMAEFLLKLGDSQYRAAIDALRQIERSSDPRREIGSAITCLRLAYETFYLNAKSSYSALDNFGSIFLFKVPNYIKAYRKPFECSMLIALCYKDLGEYSLEKTYLKKAKKCFDIYFEKCFEYLNPPELHGTLSGGGATGFTQVLLYFCETDTMTLYSEREELIKIISSMS